MPYLLSYLVEGTDSWGGSEFNRYSYIKLTLLCALVLSGEQIVVR